MVLLLLYVIVSCFGVSCQDMNETGAQDNVTSSKQFTRHKRQLVIIVKDISNADLEEVVQSPYRKGGFLDFPSDSEEVVKLMNNHEAEYQARMKRLEGQGIYKNSSKWRPEEGSYNEY